MNSQFIFRKIENPNEIDVLRGMSSEHNGFVYEYTDETINLLKKLFELEDSLNIVVMNDMDFVGFVSCDREWWEDESFFLREIFVSPHYQGQGVGRALIDICVHHAQSHGAHCLVTETAYENTQMRSLCEASGFEQWTNPRWSDGVTYKRLLRSR